jgi:hypothetical protein
MARIVAVICLSTGAVGDVAMGAYEGKGSGELGLLRTLGSAFNRGDIALAEALYCNYFSISALVQAGVEVLFEQHGARTTDFRRGQRLGSEDHVVRLSKPANRPEWMSAQHYEALPAELTVREVRRGDQVLVSTLREPSKGELFELYARRWSVELDLRNIKTTLGMDLLSCKTAQMNEKQIWVYLLAYNLIRLLMSQAAFNAAVLPRQLSFKHTVQIWTQWHAHALGAGRLQHRRRLFELIAARRVGNRPGRIEPRAVKRRPKDYRRLTTTRSEARKHLRIHGPSLKA